MATSNAKLAAYFRLHDFLSDMTESGRLTESDIPDDYVALVDQLEECARIASIVDSGTEL